MAGGTLGTAVHPNRIRSCLALHYGAQYGRPILCPKRAPITVPKHDLGTLFGCLQLWSHTLFAHSMRNIPIILGHSTLGTHFGHMHLLGGAHTLGTRIRHPHWTAYLTFVGTHIGHINLRLWAHPVGATSFPRELPAGDSRGSFPRELLSGVSRWSFPRELTAGLPRGSFPRELPAGA